MVCSIRVYVTNENLFTSHFSHKMELMPVAVALSQTSAEAAESGILDRVSPLKVSYSRNAFFSLFIYINIYLYQL